MEVKCIFCRLSLEGCPCGKVDSFFGSVKNIPKGGKPPVSPPVQPYPAMIIPIPTRKPNVDIKNT